MRNYETEIAWLKQQLAELEAKIAEDYKPKIVRWNPKNCNFWLGGALSISENTCAIPVGYSEAGFGRPTRAQAEAAAVDIRKYARLLAYKDEFAPEYEPNWTDDGKIKFRIAYCHSQKLWAYESSVTAENITVYFPKEVAASLVGKLNSGEVVL